VTAAAPSWAALLPVGTAPYLDRLSDHSDVRVWHIDLEFEPWAPAPGAILTRQETYGWKPQVVPADPRLATGVGRSVGEVEVACRLRAAGFKAAAWTDGFGSAPDWWSRWVRRPPSIPVSVRRLDEQVRAGHPALLRDVTGAWPDVVAYHDTAAVADAVRAAADGTLLFVEYKGPSLATPRKSDTISETQDLWVRTAVERGLVPLTSYVVARWRPSLVARAVLDQQWAACERPTRRSPRA
jgi:hypothetical protein